MAHGVGSSVETAGAGRCVDEMNVIVVRRINGGRNEEQAESPVGAEGISTGRVVQDKGHLSAAVQKVPVFYMRMQLRPTISRYPTVIQWIFQ